MKRVLVFIVSATLILLLTIYIVSYMITFSVQEYLSAIGFIFITASIILVYFQIRITLRYNKRKSAVEFMYNNVQNNLYPQIKDLKTQVAVLLVKQLDEEFNLWNTPLLEILNKKNINDDDKAKIRVSVIDILNFYERMSIAILKDTFDEDICYDDTGYILLKFYDWSESFIDTLQSKYKEERLFINFQNIADSWRKRHQMTKNKNKRYTEKLRSQRTIEGKGI